MDIKIYVGELEFNKGGNTIWVHSPDGFTVLRIKTLGKIKVNKCDTDGYSHCDIIVKEDINFCVNNINVKEQL